VGCEQGPAFSVGVGTAAKFGCLGEKAGGGVAKGRKTLAKKRRTERFALGRVLFHQPFKFGGQVGHAQTQRARKFTVGNGLARRRKGGKLLLKRCAQASSSP
jgi:hypothetical protein